MDTDDEIDSDLEALLYSQVHYKETLSVNLDTDTFNFTGHSQGLVKKSRLTWSIQKLLSSDEEEVWSDNKYNVTNKPSDTCILRNSVTKFVSSLKSHGVAQEQNNTAKKSPSEHMALCFAKENSHASQLNYFLDSDIEIMPDDVTATVTLQQRNMHQKMALNNGSKLENRIRKKTSMAEMYVHIKDEQSDVSPKGFKWFVLEDDLNRNGKRSAEGCIKRKMRLKGCNRNRRGYLSAKKCYICGYEGHTGKKCRRLSCSLCWEVGHCIDRCPNKFQTSVSTCKHCNVRGHMSKHCPDIWRRYHATVQQGSPVAQISKPRLLSKTSCSNCGRSGHFVDVRVSENCQVPKSFKDNGPSNNTPSVDAAISGYIECYKKSSSPKENCYYYLMDSRLTASKLEVTNYSEMLLSPDKPQKRVSRTFCRWRRKLESKQSLKCYSEVFSGAVPRLKKKNKINKKLKGKLSNTVNSLDSSNKRIKGRKRHTRKKAAAYGLLKETSVL